MKLVIGCPIYARNWILPIWYRHVMASCAGIPDLDLSFVFVVKKHDMETRNMIWDLVMPGLLIEEDDSDHFDRKHSWVPSDFERMVRLRNTMLRRVQRIAPDAFLSLDSDLLIEQQTIPAMLAGLDKFSAVGLVTSMCRQIWCESWMYYAPTHDTFVRVGEKCTYEDTFPADAIMAGKMMGPDAYKVEYKWDKQGEDLGWNRNMIAADLKRGIVGSARARHVMMEDDLEKSPVVFW